MTGAVAAVLGALVTAGCTQVVAGTPTAAPAQAPEVTAPSDAPPSTVPPVLVPRSVLQADVLPDECLLDAGELGALVGEPVLAPAQLTVDRGDGSAGSSCFAHAAEGYPVPLAAINVYAVRSGTPAEYVRNSPPQGRRELSGAGEAAVLVDTATGPTLQLAGTRHLVTMVALDGNPTDEAWRAAARSALTRLPS